MLLISKKHLVPNTVMQILRLVFIGKLFQSILPVGQLESYGIFPGLVRVKTIADLVTHVHY